MRVFRIRSKNYTIIQIEYLLVVNFSPLYMESPQTPDSQILKNIVSTPMPFGKYKGTLICDLPISYLEWFQKSGFPQGKLGMMIATIYEIKLNGLAYLLEPLKRNRKL
jgi:uncharacterized protein